ncbi:hypothetical protein DPMN_151043 [Dreissena polymorpha]|uniref:Secreted protein n=1 Tax=Dreissena polymorpha TaxID=45954 RepID=A0A9D4FKF1_DREPO|nr:hypothetical protein DPMN_151043 [Dreissena polymorpha]
MVLMLLLMMIIILIFGGGGCCKNHVNHNDDSGNEASNDYDHDDFSLIATHPGRANEDQGNGDAGKTDDHQESLGRARREQPQNQLQTHTQKNTPRPGLIVGKSDTKKQRSGGTPGETLEDPSREESHRTRNLYASENLVSNTQGRQQEEDDHDPLLDLLPPLDDDTPGRQTGERRRS